MYKVYLLLGGNLGDREKLLSSAIDALKLRIGRLLLTSSIYETSAWGNENQPKFLNQALVLETELNAFEVLDIIQEIEKRLGRKRDEHWGARTIDIDILFFDSEIIESERLKIPHPLIDMRKFVLLPLMEIIPDYLHPILKINVESLYLTCGDKLEVKKFNSK